MQDEDDWGTLKLINCIELAARSWGAGEPLLRKGDMSLRNGDEWGCDATGGGPTCCGHDSHQNGLEVDIRYLRNDNYSQGLDISDPNQKDDYDTLYTRYLMMHIITHCDINLIYVDLNN